VACGIRNGIPEAHIQNIPSTDDGINPEKAEQPNTDLYSHLAEYLESLESLPEGFSRGVHRNESTVDVALSS